MNHKKKQASNNNYCIYILNLVQGEKYVFIFWLVTLLEQITNFQMILPTL